MVIVEEILEDFLYYSEKNKDLSEILTRLGVNLLDKHNYSEKFAGIIVAKVVKQIDSTDANYIYLDEKNNEITSKQELELQDLVLINEEKEVLEYSDLPYLPILQGEGIVKLDSFHNFGTDISTSLSIRYKYILSDNVWDLFASYYDLAKAISQVEDVFILDKAPVNIQTRQALSGEEFTELKQDNLIVEAPNNTTMPQWLQMRLHLQGTEVDDFAQAVAKYVELEYGLKIELDIINNKFVYQIDEANLASKSIDRIQEIWEQSNGAKYYTQKN